MNNLSFESILQYLFPYHTIFVLIESNLCTIKINDKEIKFEVDRNIWYEYKIQFPNIEFFAEHFSTFLPDIQHTINKL